MNIFDIFLLYRKYFSVNYLSLKRPLTSWQRYVCAPSITTKFTHAECFGTKHGFDVASRSFIVKSDKIVRYTYVSPSNVIRRSTKTIHTRAIRSADRLAVDAARVTFLSKRVLYVYMAKHSRRVSQSDVPSFNVETTLYPTERLADNTLACC